MSSGVGWHRLRSDAARAVQHPLVPGAPHTGVLSAAPVIGGVFGAAAVLSALLVFANLRAPLADRAMLWFLGGLLVAGLALLALAARHWRRVRLYGRLPISLTPAGPVPGTSLAIRVDLRSPLPAGAACVARINCLALDFRPLGRRYRVYAHTLWQGRQSLLVSTDRRSLAAVFELPSNLPGGNLPDRIDRRFLDRGLDCCGWLLEVVDETGHLPLTGYYRLPGASGAVS